MRRSILVGSAAAIVVLVVAWLAANPGGRFGFSMSMLTTYNRAPLPFVDLQVRGDGVMRIVSQAHEVGADRLAWLAEPKPDVLIIALGWQGDARIKGQLPMFAQTKVVVLRTGEALKLFNSLRDKGVRAAIHVHSTD